MYNHAKRLEDIQCIDKKIIKNATAYGDLLYGCFCLASHWLKLGDLNIHGPFSYNLSMTKCIHFVSPIIHVDKCGSGMYHHQEQEATV